MNPFNSAGLFLVNTVFNLYIIIVMLRIILQWIGASFYNPVSQFILKVTNPIVTPIRKIIPPFKGIDIASILLLVFLEIIKFYVLVWLKAEILPNFIGIFIAAFGDALNTIINVFFYAIIISAILSWFQPTNRNPITEILFLLTEPLLRPMRRLIPNLGGIDISPLPVLILLQLTAIIITQPLMNIGFQLAV